MTAGRTFCAGIAYRLAGIPASKDNRGSGAAALDNECGRIMPPCLQQCPLATKVSLRPCEGLARSVRWLPALL